MPYHNCSPTPIPLFETQIHRILNSLTTLVMPCLSKIQEHRCWKYKLHHSTKMVINMPTQRKDDIIKLESCLAFDTCTNPESKSVVVNIVNRIRYRMGQHS